MDEDTFISCLLSLSAVMNVSFADVSVEVTEGVGLVSFLLLKTAGALGPVSVQVATLDQSAEGTHMHADSYYCSVYFTYSNFVETTAAEIVINMVTDSGIASFGTD